MQGYIRALHIVGALSLANHVDIGLCQGFAQVFKLHDKGADG